MTRVGIVTDSTCDLTLEELDRLGVTMVSLTVRFGDESFVDWRTMVPEDFYRRLVSSPALPQTSQPSPADFTAAYSRLADEGCEHIVSIHLSTALSGTVQSAFMAAETSPVPVTVVDTRKLTHALALVVKEAVAERDRGSDGPAVAAHAQRIAEKMRLYFVLDTLDYLIKGGRAGKASGLAATLLNIKPVLRVNDEGVVEPFKKVKGRKKALAELAAHVAQETAAYGHMRAALFHGCGADEAADLRDALVAAGADIEIESVGLVGAVVGVYAGPNSVGVAYYPLD